MGHIFTRNSGCQGKECKRVRKQRESLSGGKKVNAGSLKMSLEKSEAQQKEEGNEARKAKRVLRIVSPI